MTVFDTANRANDRAALIEYRAGHPHRKQMLVRHEDVNSGYIPVITDTVLRVPPIITTVSPKLIGLPVGSQTDAGLVVSANDQIAKVSRSLPYNLFVREDNARARVLVNPPLNALGAIIYDDPATRYIDQRWSSIIHIDDRDCCYWTLILRKERDR